MQEAIQQRCGQDRVGEEVAPGGVGLVRGKDDRLESLVAFGDDLEEERRLFFVGITRARKRLHITYARHRVVRGQRD